MNTTIDQHTIDERINRFLARKSSQRSVGDIITERLIPVQSRSRRTGIAYEPMRWTSGRLLHSQ